MWNSPTIAGFLKCNGGKVEEAEDFKCVIVIYCVLESRKWFIFVQLTDKKCIITQQSTARADIFLK